MKKITTALFLILISLISKAQNGLECILVEKYYVSNSDDSIGSVGVLPIGSTTYRIYADMLPGYKFQAAYGVPGHELRIATTTTFFNNEDRGATSPTYSKTNARNNTVMLDSWLSVGAACTGNFGILKSQDDGVATVANIDGVLQNNDVSAGIPLTSQDGLIAVTGRTPESVTFVGLTNTGNGDLGVFDATSQVGNLFSTSNGSWASLNGSNGPDTIDNKVLIAQITTDGILSFELNIQIGTMDSLGHAITENYVARNPVGNEILLNCLIYPEATDVPSIAVHSTALPSFDIYPNPASTSVAIEIPLATGNINASSFYNIYDLTGRLLMHKELGVLVKKYTGHIDISSLATGEYIIELTNAGTTTTQPLIIR